MAETAILALPAGIAGLLLAVWGVHLFAAYAPPLVGERVVLSPRVLAFGSICALSTPFLFGLLPALHVSRPNLSEALKEGLRAPLLRYGQYQLPDLLVVAEVTLAVVLVVISAFWFRFFWQLEHLQLGFEPRRLVVADLALSSARYGTAAAQIAMAEALIQRVQALPGVRRAAIADGFPGIGDEHATAVTLDGPAGDRYQIGRSLRRAATRGPVFAPVAITAGFFDALAIPLRTGRRLSTWDSEDASRVALVSESIARAGWRADDVIGKRFHFGSPDAREPWWTVVGVAGDVMTVPGLNMPGVHVWVPFSQRPQRRMTLVVRTVAEPRLVMPSIRQAIWSVDNDQTLESLGTLDNRLANRFRESHFMLALIGVFSTLTLSLAVSGVFAVASRSVAERTRDIGIRMALGAQSWAIVRAATGRGLILVGVGTALGVLGVMSAVQFSWGVVLTVAVRDPYLWIGVLVPLVAAGLLAFYVPARRATAVEPVAAIRHD